MVQATPRPSRHLLTLEPQLEWDTPALFGVGLVADETGEADLCREMHAPLAAAGVDGVKVSTAYYLLLTTYCCLLLTACCLLLTTYY